MRILWLVNAMFPYPAEQLGNSASCFGGWAHSLYQSLQKENNIDFCIVSTYAGSKLEKFVEGRTVYYLIPNQKENTYNPELKQFWKIVIEEFRPEIVHIHGTEYPKSLPLIELYPNINYVVSIQGILHACARVYNCNLDLLTLVKNITIRDLVKPKTGLLTSLEMKQRAKYEKRIIENVGNAIGRTTWDKSQVLSINPKINYYHADENLRQCFYKDEWDYNKKEEYTIFFSQAQSILKGFHIMLEALYILKKKYPKVKVVVAGNNLFDSSLVSKLKKQSYVRYLEKLVQKYELKDNIEFTGYLGAEEYKKYLLKTHVYVQASSVENSSNSLGEAMILGVPCVASNVGGTSDMLLDKKEGFLYPYTESELLAYYVDQYFESEELCKEKGKAAREHALNRHDWDSNAKSMMDIYNKLIKDIHSSETSL